MIFTQVGISNVSISPLANSASVMMPMVFWASLAPCEKAMNPAEMGWRRRNHVLTGPCCRLRTSQMRPVMSSQAPAKPRSGEPIIGTMTLSKTPLQMTPSTPAEAIIAPMRPPKSACEELEGMPKCQVAKFHTTAPMSVASTTCRVTRSVFTSPSPTVLATLVETKAPRRLSPAAMSTATRGDRARVETEVAIALAVSWKPLV